MKARPYGVQKMKVKIELLRDSLNKTSKVFVWRGMRLLEAIDYEYIIDDYEADGIREELTKKYKEFTDGR